MSTTITHVGQVAQTGHDSHDGTSTTGEAMPAPLHQSRPGALSMAPTERDGAAARASWGATTGAMPRSLVAAHLNLGDASALAFNSAALAFNSAALAFNSAMPGASARLVAAHLSKTAPLDVEALAFQSASLTASNEPPRRRDYTLAS